MANKIERLIEKLDESRPYICLGLAGLVGFSGIYSYNDLKEAKNEFESLPYKNEITRYNEINNELENLITVNEFFDEETKKYFSKMIAERDSLSSLKGFDEAREEYKNIKTKRGNSPEMRGIWSGIFALLFGTLGITEITYRSREEEDL